MNPVTEFFVKMGVLSPSTKPPRTKNVPLRSTSDPKLYLYNPFIIAHLCVLAVILPAIALTDAEMNTALLSIQCALAIAIILTQIFYNRRKFHECAVCGRIRIFHDRDKYPEFAPIVCKNFTRNGVPV